MQIYSNYAIDDTPIRTLQTNIETELFKEKSCTKGIYHPELLILLNLSMSITDENG